MCEPQVYGSIINLLGGSIHGHSYHVAISQAQQHHKQHGKGITLEVGRFLAIVTEQDQRYEPESQQTAQKEDILILILQIQYVYSL